MFLSAPLEREVRILRMNEGGVRGRGVLLGTGHSLRGGGGGLQNGSRAGADPEGGSWAPPLLGDP